MNIRFLLLLNVLLNTSKYKLCNLCSAKNILKLFSVPSRSRKDLLEVHLGDWDLSSEVELYEHQSFQIADIIIHEEFRNDTLYNDLAILKLEYSVNFDRHVAPVCLPKPEELFKSNSCFTTGWSRSHYTPIMRENRVYCVERDECQERLRETRLGPRYKLHPSFICADNVYYTSEACNVSMKKFCLSSYLI